MKPEEKLEHLLSLYRRMWPNITFDLNSLVRRGGTVRLRDLAYSSDHEAYKRVVIWAEQKLSGFHRPTVVEPEKPKRENLSKKVDEMLKGYQPKFGDRDHINFLERLGQMRELRQIKKNAAKKRGDLQKAIEEEGFHSKELDRVHGYIIQFLENYHATKSTN